LCHEEENTDEEKRKKKTRRRQPSIPDLTTAQTALHLVLTVIPDPLDSCVNNNCNNVFHVEGRREIQRR